MTPPSPSKSSSRPAAVRRKRGLSWDGLGIAASVTCAIHCMAAPIVLALSPLLGSVWASPYMHWAFASVSLPAVYWLVRRDVRVHQRAWILWMASAGIVGVLIGLVAPAMAWSHQLALVVDAPAWLEALTGTGVESGCTDECCASMAQGEDGARFRLPFASLVTMAGGVLLVTSHVANLCVKGRCTRASCACD